MNTSKEQHLSPEMLRETATALLRGLSLRKYCDREIRDFVLALESVEYHEALVMMGDLIAEETTSEISSLMFALGIMVASLSVQDATFVLNQGTSRLKDFTNEMNSLWNHSQEGTHVEA